MKNKLKLRRVELGLIQIRAAQKAGIHTTRLSYIENELAEPTDDEIKALAKALKTTPAELFPSLAEQQNAGAR
jgi:transcriptional regulator with XRE-family HTH domain